MKKMAIGVAGLFVLLPSAWAQQAASPLEKYRNLKFPPAPENFDKGWKDRVALDYEIINTAKLKSLRAALKDKNTYVRALAARALGIRGDKASAVALAKLARRDPQPAVRIRAVESLGLLKRMPKVIGLAKKDRHGGVRWSALMAEGQLKGDSDYGALVRQAFAKGIQREAMGLAKIGQRAPDFAALTSDGKPFKLSSVLGKKPLVLYFAAFDAA